MSSKKTDEYLIEANVELPVCEFARGNGWRNRKLKWIGRRGAPDRLFGKKGHKPRLVEFKRPGAKPSKQQLREHERLRNMGFEVYVIDNVEDGYALFS